MNIPLPHAGRAQHAGAFHQIGIRGGDEAGVSGGAEIFCWIEAERGGIAKGPCRATAPCRSEGLRGVFDQEQVVAAADLAECVHVGALAVKMDGHNGAHTQRGIVLLRIEDS